MVFPILLALLFAGPPQEVERARPDPAPLVQFPLRKGSRWVYEGEAEWTRGDKVQSGRVREVMEVLAYLPGPEASFAAVVRGFPLDLAWYQPGRKAAISILVCRKGRFYQRPSSGLKHALVHARILLADPAFPTAQEEDPFLDLPLAAGKVWGTGASREDGMYCWVVEGPKARPFTAPAVARGAAFQPFTAVYRTNPDHMSLDFAPGLGLTAFSYEHHGTVARTQVRLVAYHPQK